MRWVFNPFKGCPEPVIPGPEGPPGDEGPQGDPGAPGADGDSAYEVAVAEGFVGDEAAWLASLVGPEGPQGDPGLTGSQGPPGDDGAPGADGTDGKTVLNGAGAPGAGLGVDGDFYIDTTADAVYGPKTAGAWGSPTSLVGPAGDEGPQGDPGTTLHEGLTDVTADQHHAKSHAHDGGDGSGTVSHGDLTDIGPDDHHDEVHQHALPGLSARYIFSTATTDADPGAGMARFNHASPGSATAILMDDLDTDGATRFDLTAQSLFLPSTLPLAALVVKESDPTKWWLFEVLDVAGASGYFKFIGANGNATNATFSDGDVLIISLFPWGEHDHDADYAVIAHTHPVELAYLDRSYAAVDVSNTTTETDIYNRELSVDEMDDQGLDLEILASYTNSTGTNRTCVFNVYLGATQIIVGGSATNIIAGSNRSLSLRLRLRFAATGASGLKATVLEGRIGPAGNTQANNIGTAVDSFYIIEASSTTAVDTTAARTLRVTATHSFASSSVSYNGKAAILRAGVL